MFKVGYRAADQQDIIAMAEIRAANSGTIDYWKDRIEKYLRCELNPQQALPPRIIYVAEYPEKVIGFAAAHLTSRLDCNCVLQWIDVKDKWRRNGIGTKLLHRAAGWFLANEAYKVCVDPGNDAARSFYYYNGAKNLNQHWLYWENVGVLL
jgi:GNAT superfamily N-acetyltransferase